MKAKNVTKRDLERALAAINLLYKGNVAFKTLEPTGPRRVSYNFSLTVNSSSAPGHRRRLAAACWHVHGHFFEALFKINERAVIITSGRNGLQTVDIHDGNWIDWQIGSLADPLYYSEACDC